MSLIRHGFFPRSMFSADMWPGASSDWFDPFDELDRMMARNFHWLNVPDFLSAGLVPRQPRVPNKYRIRVDCAGYSPSSIKIDLSSDKTKLIVRGKEGDDARTSHNNHDDCDDYSLRQFQKTFKLPANVELDKMASFVTSSQQLVIEIPLKEEENANGEGAVANRTRLLQANNVPRIVDAENNRKEVVMSLNVPHGIDPSKVKVTCKDRDLIVQAEDKRENSDRCSQTYYYQRCTLPENTDFNSLKCTLDNNVLAVRAPLDENFASNQRQIPIELANDRNKAIENK